MATLLGWQPCEPGPFSFVLGKNVKVRFISTYGQTVIALKTGGPLYRGHIHLLPRACSQDGTRQQQQVWASTDSTLSGRALDPDTTVTGLTDGHRFLDLSPCFPTPESGSMCSWGGVGGEGCSR